MPACVLGSLYLNLDQNHSEHLDHSFLLLLASFVEQNLFFCVLLSHHDLLHSQAQLKWQRLNLLFDCCETLVQELQEKVTCICRHNS